MVNYQPVDPRPVFRRESIDFRFSIKELKKATPQINPGARDRDSELFSGSTNESGGLYPGCFRLKEAFFASVPRIHASRSKVWRSRVGDSGQLYFESMLIFNVLSGTLKQ
jgi:hypothetical protein